MKLLLNENEKLKSKVSQLQQENEKLVSELKDKEATILTLKEKCNSIERLIKIVMIKFLTKIILWNF